ncbi:MAG: MFS transporter [Rubellimicrobium sp.]|nr:MFS transporter [Rubellimicrobium sp.]
MSAAPTAPGLSPGLRTAAFYLALFAPNGGAAVLGAVWLAGRGLGPEEIGIVNAAPMFAMLVLSVVVGRLADRAPDWKGTIVIGSAVSAAFALGLGQGFGAILLFWAGAMLAHSAIVPVTDAAAMRLVARSGGDFGTLRAWGTFGYLLVLVLAGFAAPHAGADLFLWIFAGLAVLRWGLALQLPRFRATPDEAAPVRGATRLREVLRPWFVLPLAGWAAIFGTHTVINAFMGLMWVEQCIGMEMVGLLIAIGAVSETLVFIVFGRIAPRVRTRTLILASAVITCLRWGAMAFSPGLAGLFVLQSLHGLSYGLGFLACVAFIARWTADGIAAEAQGLFTALQQAMSVVSLYGFGWLMGQVGESAWWGATALALAGTAAIWWSWRLPPPDGPLS